MRPRFIFVSTIVHAAAIALLLLAAVLAPDLLLPPAPTIFVVPVTPLKAPRVTMPAREGGGGGQQSEQPARKGKLPEPRRTRLFTPPQVARVDTPRLTIMPAMMNAPEMDAQFMNVGIPAGGIGGDLGIGKGRLGIGDYEGPGSGKGKSGFGEGDAYLGKLSRSPQLIYKQEPEYSEDARKARVQGKVILLIDVGLDGRAKNIRIVQGLGLGLDEAAIKAIEQWRFRPALAGDQPVVAPARVEVGFQLL